MILPYRQAKLRLLVGVCLAAFYIISVDAQNAPAPQSGSVNVRDYGAIGDGGPNTDDSIAIQAAIDALNTSGLRGGTVYFPPGRYRAKNLMIPVFIRELILAGAGRSDASDGGSWLINIGPDPLLTTVGTGSFVNFYSRDLSFRQEASEHGDIFAIEHSPSFLSFERVGFLLANPASSFFRAETGNPAHILFDDVQGLMAKGASEPAISIISSQGKNIFGVNISNTRVNADPTATAPIFRLENGCGGCVGYGPRFQNVTLEAPGGGGIHLYSFTGSVLENVVATDLGGAKSVAPIVLISRSDAPGSGEPQHVVFIGSALLATPAIEDVIRDQPEVRLTARNGGAVFIASRINSIDSAGSIELVGGSRIGCIYNSSPLVFRHDFEESRNICAR